MEVGAGPDASSLQRVLRAYGLEGWTLTPLQGGMINQNYAVEATGQARYVLKCYAPMGPGMETARIERGCEAQRFARQSGLPVPAVIESCDGGALTELEGRRYVLMDYVPGVQHPRGSMPSPAARSMGVALARLLAVLEHFPRAASDAASRRPAWQSKSLGTPPATVALPGPDEASALLERLLRAAEVRRRSDPVDEAACQMLEHKLRGLEGWSMAPALEPAQWIHGDFQDSNVIFADQDRVAGIIDFDAVSVASRGYEVMRAFAYSFPEGSPGGYDFLGSFVAAAGITGEEAASYVDLRSYVELMKVWPLNERYLAPEHYQPRWDEFISPPSGWWEAHAEEVRACLVSSARGRHSAS